MKFAKYWAKSSSHGFTCWRSSDTSLQAAEALAQEGVRALVARFESQGPPLNRYGYTDRPLREQVLREIHDPAGGLAAAVTRNSYGCLVLNTSRVMFVDVDLPEGSAGSSREADVVARSGAWAQAHPGWGWRVYRTRAGVRLLATHALFDPDGEAAGQVFEALGADPLYQRLCGVQQCFRARLTPKPWRCGCRKPPRGWPWPDARAEARFKEWLDRYGQACRAFATCELIAGQGAREAEPTARLIVQAHDEAVLAAGGLQLA